jgi:two-component system response regulator WspF
MRIAIVNDSLMAIEAMRRIVSGSHRHNVAWIATNGVDAVEQAAADHPDLILMDLVMPIMDGVEATRQIMTSSPCPIVVVTANVTGNCSQVFEAMGYGALDAVNTPILEGRAGSEKNQPLLGKIETISKLVGERREKKPAKKTPAKPRGESLAEQLVIIGASAGGPIALSRILSALPPDYPAGIIVVQHVDPQFSSSLAGWLHRQTELEVRLAVGGDRPRPGVVLLADSRSHLVFTGPRRLGYSREPLDCFYQPSIDVFFKSAGHFWKGEILAALLTGMGRDGAEGLRELREQGHHTMAQDQATSTVYGMPKAAAEVGAASEIIALEDIAAGLLRFAHRKVLSHG